MVTSFLRPTASDSLRRTARRNRFAAFGIWISRYYLCQNAPHGRRDSGEYSEREQCASLPSARQNPPNGASSYFVEPGVEILQHGEACLRNEPVSGRLRRPPGNANRPRALSSLDRARARPDRQRVRSPHVRGDALLGRRPSRVERGATGVRGGVAAPTEVGRVAFVEVTRPQRHTC